MIMKRLPASLTALAKKLSQTAADGNLEPKRDAPLSKREIIVAASICLVIVGAAIGSLVWYVQSHSKGSADSTQQNARGYTLTPPEGWSRVTPTPEGASVAFSAPPNGANGASRTFVAVQSSGLNPQSRSASFESISQAYMAQLSQSYDNFQLQSTRQVTLAGLPATLVTYSYASSLATQTSQSLFTVKDGISYIANGESPTAQWDMYSAKIEASLLTFRP